MKILRQLLLLSGTAMSGTAAFAQTYTSGAEVVPTWTDAVAWTPPIAPDSPHPADAQEPPVAAGDNVLYNRELWVNATNQRTQIGAVNGDGKFRTECKFTFTKRADPLLFPGQYPAGHAHSFAGPSSAFVEANVHNFNYAMGRNNPASSCQGGPLNTTLYWEPSVIRTIGGVNFVVLPDNATFYYTHPGSKAAETTRLRRDYRFIGGANPMNYNDTARRAEYAAGGLEYPGSPDTAPGFGGIQCYPTALGGLTTATVLAAHAKKSTGGVAGTSAARYTKGPNGEDPWGGACTTGTIVIIVNAPDCWDGTNLSSPDGRSHVRYSTRDGKDNVPGPGQCPSNYVKTLAFETKIFATHKGWAGDLEHWWMSSDRMRVATTECPDAATPCDGVSGGNVPATVNGVAYTRVSKDPCRATGVDFCNFSTAHFDWWGSWDDATIKEWQRNCGGLTIGGVVTNYADCGSGGLADNRSLISSGTPPQPNLSTNPVRSQPVDRASASTEGQRYFPVRVDDQYQGPLVIDHGGHGGGE